METALKFIVLKQEGILVLSDISSFITGVIEIVCHSVKKKKKDFTLKHYDSPTQHFRVPFTLKILFHCIVESFDIQIWEISAILLFH